ncbi:MAG: flagellar motor protein MotB, partial [Rhodothermales bacterium]
MSDLLDIEDDESGAPSAPLWVVTYSDMVTLLLTFFVMIVSMSEVEVKKFKEALSYFQGRTGTLTHDAIQPTAAQQLVMAENFQSREQAERYETLLEYLEENGLQDNVQVDLTDKGLHIVITDSVMFDTGKAELIEPARTILRLVA